MTNKVSTIDKVTMWVLLLAPILSIYGNVGGWSFYGIITLLLSVFYFGFWLIKYHRVSGDKNPLSKGLLSYFIYWGIVFTLTAIYLPLAMLQVYLLFFLFYGTFRGDFFTSIYKPIGLICIIFFFFQELTFQTTGVRISGIFSFLPLSAEMNMRDIIWQQSVANRSCSFFSEPAHFAQFLLPLLAIELYHEKTKTHMIYAVLIVMSLLLLRSGNGLIGMGAVMLFLIPFYLKKGTRSKWLSLLLIVSFISIIGYYYVHSEMGDSLMERQSELSSDYTGGAQSGFLRVWRGFFVYSDYSLIEKIIGCPNEITQLAHVKAAGMYMLDDAALYFNAFQKLLLNTGLVGLGIFVFIFANIWRGNTVCGKAILGALIALSFISGIFLSYVMILYLVLAESMKMNPKSKAEKINT